MGKSDNESILAAAFSSLLKCSKDMIFVKDVNLVYCAASMPFIEMIGKTSEAEVIGRTDEEIFADISLAKRYVADDMKLLESGEDLNGYVEPIPDDNGFARYGSTSKCILRNEQGEAIGILGITRDVTRAYIVRRHYEQELKYLFELPRDTYAVSYLDIDDWRVISQRRQIIEGVTLQECHSIEGLVGAALASFEDQESPVAEFYRNFNREHLQLLYSEGKIVFSFRYRRKMARGDIRWIRNEIRFMMDVDSGHLCAMLTARDIDEKKRNEEKLFTAAHMDEMTMLFNRSTTMERIGEILADRREQFHALFMLDIDNFKRLNDTRGHIVGDEFLVELADVLRCSFREQDVVGRIGGDEFFAFMCNVPDMKLAKRKAELMLQKIRKVCEKYKEVGLSASIGISMYPTDGNSLEEIYAKADEALYKAKRNGKDCIAFVSSVE